MRWAGLAGGACAVALIALATTCSSVPSSPTTPFAIQLDNPLVPSVVLTPGSGVDTLRDTTGCALPLQAQVFNSSGGVIPDAPVRYLRVDTSTAAAVDSITGIVTGVHTGVTSILAAVGGLQSAKVVITVVPNPDTIVPLDSARDSLLVLQFSDVRLPLRALVEADTTAIVGAPLAPVASLLVRYGIAFPVGQPTTDTSSLGIVTDALKAGPLDSTDATGTSNRTLRFPPTFTFFTDSIPDSVVVTITADVPRQCTGTADERRVPVPGSPVTYWRQIVKTTSPAARGRR